MMILSHRRMRVRGVRPGGPIGEDGERPSLPRNCDRNEIHLAAEKDLADGRPLSP